MILGILAGVDFFETDYPLDLASKNQALILNTRSEADYSHSLNQLKSQVSSTLSQDHELMLAVECESRTPNLIDVSKEDSFVNTRFNSSPLQPGCQCYCCQNYTVAYLFHLFDVSEMNANILLAIHNAHVFDQLFVALQESKSTEYLAWLLLT